MTVTAAVTDRDGTGRRSWGQADSGTWVGRATGRPKGNRLRDGEMGDDRATGKPEAGDSGIGLGRDVLSGLDRSMIAEKDNG